ncbi:MAG: hypothetical protein GX045_00345 [Clostridiaceae bacterium]|jgi:hypothetical protein|nr:hypothetical protein [Clostridiaceae bacterium]
MIKITNAKAAYEREPLIASFGFKGNYVTELWQSAVKLEDGNGLTGMGLGVQSILWSDSNVFSGWGEFSAYQA